MKKAALVLIAAFPAFAHAQTFRQIVDGTIVPFIDGSVIPLLYALAFLFFIYGMARFFMSPSEEAREMGRQHALWGIIALALLFSVWSVVRLLVSTLGV